MLDARDDLTSTTRVPYGGDEFEANHWANVEPVVTRAPRSSLENGSSPISSAAGSGRNSPSGSGLRSRRAALQGQSGLGYGHRRSSTADDGVLAAAAVHPLQPSSPSRMGLSRSAEEGVTRPALKRLLSDKGLWPESAADTQEGVQDDGIRKRGNGEMLVIVHEVSRTDSLAGVALKYGISLTDLRKVNQLWASDSIHLRKSLHIPLHLTDGKRFPIDGVDVAVNGCDTADDPFSSDDKPTTAVKRIPISQLKFFPPSSHPSQSPRNGSKVLINASDIDSSYSPSASTQTLTSFLHALPLPSRQTFFARLSIDSSETSSATGASETSSDQEHELDELGRRSLRDEGRTPTAQQRLFASSPSPYRKQAALGRAALMSKRDSGSEATVLMSDFNIDSIETVPLQTEQLKPSPRMELPRVSRGAQE